MTDLVAWMRAQLDTDERDVERMEHATDSSEAYSCPATRDYALGDLAYGEENCTCSLAARKARVLRQVQAHRAILDLYEELYEPHLYEACQHLAAIYSDRDGYKEEWSA